MARGGNRGTKGGGVSVNPSTTNIRNNRYGGGFGGFGSPFGGGFGQAPQPQAEPQPVLPTGIVAGGPNPYGRGNSLGASSARIINDMRRADMFGGYQGLPQERPQPMPFRPQIEPMPRYAQPMYSAPYQPQPMYSAPYQPQPMPFRAPSPGKGGSKGGGMNVPPMRQPMPMMGNPLGNRGGMMQQRQAALQGLGGFFR